MYGLQITLGDDMRDGIAQHRGECANHANTVAKLTEGELSIRRVVDVVRRDAVGKCAQALRRGPVLRDSHAQEGFVRGKLRRIG